MPVYKRQRIDDIVLSGGAIAYQYNDTVDTYIIQGGAGGNLTGGIGVTRASGVSIPSPVDGESFPIEYIADAVYTGGNVITIFGRALTAQEARTNLNIEARYNLATTSYDVTIEAMTVATSAVTITGTDSTSAVVSSGLAAWWTNVKTLVQTFVAKVTFSVAFAITTLNNTKILASSSDGTIQEVDLYETIVIPVSFEAGEQAGNEFQAYYSFDIVYIRAWVTKAIAATDDATISVTIDGTPVTTGSLTLTASSATSTTFATTPTALNAGNGSVIAAISSKTTAGGKALVTIILKRKLV